MTIRTYKVTLDSKNTIAPEPVFLRQGDKTGAVVIDATLMDNGAPISIYGLKPSFMANTADGKAVVSDTTGFSIVDASGGEFTYQVPSQLGSIDGKIQIAYFSFLDSYGAQSTFNVVFVVEKAADMTKDSAKDWVSNLNEIIDKYNQWVNSSHSYWQDFVNGNKEIIESIDPGGTLLTEIIDARKPASKPSYTTLGERLNDELELLIGDVGDDVDGGIQDYMKPLLAETLVSINTSKFNLGFGTDYHYDIATDYNPHKGDYKKQEIAAMWNAGLRKSLNITSLSTKMDAVVFGGDNVDSPDVSVDNTGRSTMLKENKDFANTVFTSTKAPTFILKGNHDCNYYSGNTPDTIITDTELGSIYRQRDALFDEHRLNNLNYFYKDFDSKKVRLIGLDMYDMPETAGTDGTMTFDRFTTSGLQQAQLDWLANDALLNVPDDYVVLVAGHCSPDGTIHSGRSNHNHSVLKAVLEAFVSGKTTTIVGTDTDMPATVECKFTKVGHIAGFLCGHWHKDESVTINGINYIGTRCSLTAGDNMDGAKRMAQFETSNEDAFDIVTIDNANKSLTMHRVGAGSDNLAISTRTFSYE